jgi:hypothetical protein
MSAFGKSLLAGAACAAMIALAACSSSSSSTTPPATSPSASAPASPSASAPASTSAASPSASAPATLSATQQTIAANWVEFFNPKVATATRLGLLEDGPSFTAALSGMAASSTAAETTAKVVSVTVTSSTQAKVVYDLLLSGTPVLSDQSGTSVLQDGIWKVSVTSFCSLLALQSAGNTSSLPAACKS